MTEKVESTLIAGVFEPSYADGRALESAHLDSIVKWGRDCAELAVRAVIPHGGWGILEASAPSPESAEFFALEAPQERLTWGRITFILPNGSMGVLSAGSRQIFSKDACLCIAPRRAGLGFNFDANIELHTEDHLIPPLLRMSSGGVTCLWPTAYLGSTPQLRRALNAFRQITSAVLSALDPKSDRWQPMLLLAANLLPSTPVVAALPLLHALDTAVRGAFLPPLLTDSTWPTHDQVLELLRDLTAKLPDWKQRCDVALKFEGELARMDIRVGRRYSKNAGAEVRIEGFPLGVKFGPDWLTARGDGSDSRPNNNIPGEWTSFQVRFPLNAGSAKETLAFVVNGQERIEA